MHLKANGQGPNQQGKQRSERSQQAGSSASPTSDNVWQLRNKLPETSEKAKSQLGVVGGCLVETVPPRSVPVLAGGEGAAGSVVTTRRGRRQKNLEKNSERSSGGRKAGRAAERPAGVGSSNAAGAGAPESCNTGALSSQGPESPSPSDSEGRNPIPLETGGFDMLQVAIYGGWDAAKFAEVTKRWELHRSRAEEGDAAGAVFETRSGGMRFDGGSMRSGGCWFRYVCEWNGCRLAFVNRAEASEKMHSVWIQIGSLPLMTQGLDAVWSELLELLAELGFVVDRESVSRVDLAVDLPGVQVSEFTKLALGGCEITKAGEGSLRFGRLIEQHETFYRGAGRRVLMRIYDKLLEVANDPVKEAVLIAKRWGGERPEAATRVEFQVGRESLRETWGVQTLEELKRALPDLVTWAAEDWYRLAESPVDRENKNHSRAKTAAVWRKVQQAFVAWVTVPEVAWIVPAKVLQSKAEHVRKMAMGCLAKYLALAEPLVATAGDVTSAVFRMVDESKQKIIQRVEDARMVLTIKYGDGVEWDPSGWKYNGPDSPPIRQLQSA